MRFRVQIGPIVWEQIDARYGSTRTAAGQPSRLDFENGPLAAAALQFSRFDLLGASIGESVRHCHVLAPGFGAIVFIGVLVGEDVVEIGDFTEDPEYWDKVNEDPNI
ncbi:MAG: hypothetical protein ACT4OX_06630 [Actinomycetota bacterium]